MDVDALIATLKSDEIKESAKEFLEETVSALCGDPIACKNLMQRIITFPISLREQYFWVKFYDFLKGTYSSEECAISLYDKLFGTEEDKKRNSMRLVEAIGKIETEENLQFMINATRSLSIGLISNSDYFRIVKAVTETLYEDLIYLSKHITEQKEFRGNMNVLSLARSGLMIDAGIDANADVENQIYVFSSLGRLVDQYAISFENDERFNWYKNNIKFLDNYNTGNNVVEF